MRLSPLLWVLAWLSSSNPSAAASTTALAPFKTVQVSVPFNVKISPGAKYSFSISADRSVLDAVSSTVSNSVLYLETHGNFKSQQPISATVFLPADSLQQVLVRTPNNTVAVDTGFSVQAFSANAAGTSTLYVQNLVAQQVSVTSMGATSSFLSGSLGAVSLTGSGVSNFYLQGKAASVALDLTGVSNAESAINSDNLQITGNVAFPGHVSYTHGTCSLSEGGRKRRSLSQKECLLSDILGSPCQQVSSTNIPTPDLRFTCGIDVKESSSGGNGNNGGVASGSNGSNGKDGSSDEGDGSGNRLVGDAGGTSGENDGSDGSNGSGGITIEPLDCRSSAARNMF